MPAPLQSITLPSLGQLYGDKLPGGTVQIRKLKIDELAIFESAGDSFGRTESIIKASATFPQGFDTKTLLAGDRLALLIALRNLSLPVKYPIKYRCTGCGKFNVYKFDPLELTAKMATEADPLVEPFDVPLPDFGKTLQMRFTRGNDIDQTTRYVTRMESQNPDAKGVSEKHSIARCIVSIDGQPVANLAQVENQIVPQFTLYDTLTIRSTVEKKEPGIDLTILPECGFCGAVNEQEMPLTQEFFRPSVL